MRTAQDQYKMQIWNSFPPLFQNTIFHGEQVADRVGNGLSNGAFGAWKGIKAITQHLEII
jgi:hypothetical protein